LPVLAFLLAYLKLKQITCKLLAKNDELLHVLFYDMVSDYSSLAMYFLKCIF